MKRVLLILIISLLSSFGIAARETVRGTVYDNKGNPIPGVKVEIPGTSDYAFTDLDGVFQIILREPVKKLNFTYPGFGTSSHNVAADMKIILGKGWEGQTECYRGMFDLEGGLGIKSNVTIKSGDCEMRDIHSLLLAGASTTHGSQITRNFFLGFGTGAYLEFTQFGETERYSSGYSNYRRTEFTGVNIPLFIAARWDFGLTKKTAPYVGLRLGYSVYVPLDGGYLGSVYSSSAYFNSHLQVDRNCIGSWFFQPMAGYRMTLYRKLSLNLGLSYLSSRYSKYSAVTWGGPTSFKSKFIQRDAGTILFNIGFDF